MYQHYDHPAPPYHPGLMGAFGGVINLTTAVLYGGARIVRTVVEGTVWHAEYPSHHHDCCHQHVCHVHCCPETYHCGGCC